MIRRFWSLLQDVIYHTRLEAMMENELLLVTHLEEKHGEDQGKLIAEKMQSILDCRQRRKKSESELYHLVNRKTET